MKKGKASTGPALLNEIIANLLFNDGKPWIQGVRFQKIVYGMVLLADFVQKFPEQNQGIGILGVVTEVRFVGSNDFLSFSRVPDQLGLIGSFDKSKNRFCISMILDNLWLESVYCSLAAKKGMQKKRFPLSKVERSSKVD